MLNPGYLYILVNPSMDGLVKIGKTTRDPAGRARELSSVTGIPTPFIVAYESYVSNCDEAERFVHAVLEQRFCRVADNREFFQVPVPEAVRAVIHAENIFGIEVPLPSGESDVEGQAEPWREMMEQGYNYYLGENGELQDVHEALKCFTLAKKLGGVHANWIIGMILNNPENTDIYNRRRALDFFKQGATAGDDSCYVSMASIFAGDNHRENWLKCWDAVFESDTHAVTGIEGYCYLCEASDHNWPMKYLQVTRGIREEILTCILEHIRDARADYNQGAKSGEDELVNRKLIEHWNNEYRRIRKILS